MLLSVLVIYEEKDKRWHLFLFMVSFLWNLCGLYLQM